MHFDLVESKIRAKLNNFVIYGDIFDNVETIGKYKNMIFFYMKKFISQANEFLLHKCKKKSF